MWFVTLEALLGGSSNSNGGMENQNLKRREGNISMENYRVKGGSEVDLWNVQISRREWKNNSSLICKLIRSLPEMNSTSSLSLSLSNSRRFLFLRFCWSTYRSTCTTEEEGDGEVQDGQLLLQFPVLLRVLKNSRQQQQLNSRSDCGRWCWWWWFFGRFGNIIPQRTFQI